MNQTLKIISQTINTHGELLLATTTTYRNPLYTGEITGTDFMKNYDLDEKLYDYFVSNFSAERVESLDAQNAAIVIAESTIIRYYPHTVETRFETIELRSIGERFMKEYYADRRVSIAVEPKSKDRHLELAVTFHTIQFGKPRSEMDHKDALNNGVVLHEWVESNGKHYIKFITQDTMLDILSRAGSDDTIPMESGVCVASTIIWREPTNEVLEKKCTWSYTKINLNKWWKITDDIAKKKYGPEANTALHHFIILDPDIIVQR